MNRNAFQTTTDTRIRETARTTGCIGRRDWYDYSVYGLLASVVMAIVAGFAGI